LGLFRLSNPQQEATDLPDDAARQIDTVSAAARYWQAAGAEVDAFDRLAAATPRGFDDLPVTLISAGRDIPDAPQVREVLDELDRGLVSRTPGIAHHIIEDADHLTLLTVEEHARAVGELITALLGPAGSVGDQEADAEGDEPGRQGRGRHEDQEDEPVRFLAPGPQTGQEEAGRHEQRGDRDP
jgi:hypothetical protein